MMLNKNAEVNITNKNISRYRDLGYKDIKSGDKLTIDIKHLPMTSRYEVGVICVNCKIEKNIRYGDYNKITKNGTSDYYCKNCKSVKTKITNNLKYGVDNTFQLESSKIKAKETCLLRYGVEHHLQNTDIMNKLKETNNTRYGVDFVQQNKIYRDKKEATSLLKYGNKTSLMNDDVKDKIKNTMVSKYGVINPLDNKQIREKSNNTRTNNIIKSYDGLDILSISGNVYTISCDCGEPHTFDITSSLLYNRHIKLKTKVCTVCNEMYSYSMSGYQIELHKFITDNYFGEVLSCDRVIINKELDIYLPELKLAIEFNGVYYHNELYKDNNYHKIKSDLCDEKEIQLIHIWEDDWVNKKDIIKSMLLNKISNTNTVIYGRKTHIKEIDSKKCKLFLDNNHIQGNVNSPIRMGLYHGQELVSIMTFGKLRKVLNSKNESIDEYEMYRFCNKLNTNVVGGASKLFNYFIKNYSPIKIISYADRSYSKGNLYDTLGFEFSHITEPNYHYVIQGIRYNRFNFRKDILVKQGFDKTKTEHEIMLERSYYRIYNSGNYKYVYNR